MHYTLLSRVKYIKSQAEDDLGGRDGVEETAGGRTDLGWAEAATFLRGAVLADLGSRSERRLVEEEERMGGRRRRLKGGGGSGGVRRSERLLVEVEERMGGRRRRRLRGGGRSGGVRSRKLG
ncbi:hypothetical protein TIFTF001_001334 [Ficus carica]|uniref:Uncharacterized protein n=1 Tax=Ficus carica TaxID=3494 RepID=A0AA87ZFD0_FICCA|nr:hypothetical protein TIFTF001_001334 [Ficus carica]